MTDAAANNSSDNFFMNNIVPHVMRFQKPALHANNVVATPSSQSSSQGKENFMSRLVNKLESVVENSPGNTVRLSVLQNRMHFLTGFSFL